MAWNSQLSSSRYKPGEHFRRFHLERMAASQLDSLETSQDFMEEDETEESALEVEVTDKQAQKGSAKSANNKRKAPPSQTRNNKKAKKFSWSTEKVDDLLRYIKEYKSNCDFKGIDFEADLATMYTEVRKCMARDYTLDFGPEQVSNPEIEIKDMDKERYDKYMKESEAEKSLIRNGYSRVKEKIKSLRQDYRNAVNRGTRSGSGRIVQEIYELLAEIWGGSPATTSLSFGVDGDSITEGNYSFEDSPEADSSRLDDSLSNETGDDSSTKGDQPKVSAPSNIPKLIDNKRKHMEKRLSQAQRDQVLMNSAKEDMLMKRNMLQVFEKSNKTMEVSIDKMTTCLTSLGDGIASGMQMLSMALSQNQPPAPHLARDVHPYPVAQAHPHTHPAQYGGYTPRHQQYDSSSSISTNRNQATLSNTHGAISAAHQALYGTESNENI